MKKFLCALLVLCLVFCLYPIAASATTNSYYLSEIGMEILIPEEFTVFTRNTPSNDPALSAYGLTKEDLTAIMEESGGYLNAVNDQLGYEVIVTATESAFADYNQFSDTSLSGLISAMEPELAGMGLTITGTELYHHNQAKFVKMYFSKPNNGETSYGLQCHTVYDGKAINITLHSYLWELDSYEDDMMQNILDSIRFDAEPQHAEIPEETDAFIYTDTDSGMSFTVPANWLEASMTEDRKYLDAKFVSNKEEGLCIIFTSTDLLSEDVLEDSGISTLQANLLSRADMNNSIFTKADVAAMMNCSVEDISMVNYGEKEYFSAEVITSGTAYGLTLSSPMFCLLRCENGYMYMFQFNNSNSSTYFKDLEMLVSSAKYPAIEETDKTAQNQVVGSYVILVTFVLIALCIGIIFIVRFVIKKKTPRTTASFIFCQQCGTTLVPGSVFCNHCGTKVSSTEERNQI